MIKRTSFFLLAVFTALIGFSSVAHADSLFRLRLEDLATGQGVVISDNGIGDAAGTEAGLIMFYGSLGTFNINVTTGVSKPNIGGVNNYAELDLGSLNVSYSGAGSLRITLEDSNYTLGPDGPLSLVGLVGGTLTAPTGSSITFQSWVNDANLVPDFGADSPLPTVLAPMGLLPAGSTAAYSPGVSFGPGAFSASGSQEFTKSGSYSLFSQATLVFSGSGMASFDQNANVVPEPTSLLLLGTGLAALGFLGRKRKVKQS